MKPHAFLCCLLVFACAITVYPTLHSNPVDSHSRLMDHSFRGEYSRALVAYSYTLAPWKIPVLWLPIATHWLPGKFQES